MHTHPPLIIYCSLGQFGKVFKGIYIESGIGRSYTVAVKTIRTEYESEKAKEDFLKEMDVLSKLLHPNIVRLFGLVQQGIYKAILA